MNKLPLMVSALPSAFPIDVAAADFGSGGCLATAILALPSANSRIATGKNTIILFIAFTSNLAHIVASVYTIPRVPPMLLQEANRSETQSSWGRVVQLRAGVGDMTQLA